MTAISVSPLGIVRVDYIVWALGAFGILIAATAISNLWLLNFIHIISSLLWTGIDLFMGFVLGPIIRRLDLKARRDIASGLTPKTLVLLPTLSIMSATSGWFLAQQLGYTSLAWPEFGWVVAALTLVGLMTVVGLGVLLPLNISVCLELQKSNPELQKIGNRMRLYFYGNAMQGLMQVATIIIMTKFRVGI